MAEGIRRRALAHTVVHGGYLSQACSSAEILSLLYGHEMKLGPSKGPMVPPRYLGWQETKNERVSGMVYNGGRSAEGDRFFLSPTHYALVVYAALIEAGRLDPEALDQFNTDGSRLEMIGGERSPGHEVNGGSFGQAISQAAGVAWARRHQGDSGRVFVLLGDGELQEGQTWEAIMSMAFHKLDNMTMFIDVNGQQVDGRVEDTMNLEPIVDKFTAFGCAAVKVDGHDLDAMSKACNSPHKGKPLVVLCYTSPMQGIPLLKSRWPNLHYVRFKSEAERAEFQEALDAMQSSEGKQ
ncbi:transketolase [Rhodobacteraceae bacterium NNCM2]|nr:transketolase [Coraliihabitans acroporae]